jgi:hypothetical protein
MGKCVECGVEFDCQNFEFDVCGECRDWEP